MSKTTGKVYKTVNEMMILGALKLGIFAFGVAALVTFFISWIMGLLFVGATVGSCFVYKRVKNKLTGGK